MGAMAGRRAISPSAAIRGSDLSNARQMKGEPRLDNGVSSTECRWSSWRHDPGSGGRLDCLFSERNEAGYQAQACVQNLATEAPAPAPAMRKETP